MPADMRRDRKIDTGEEGRKRAELRGKRPLTESNALCKNGRMMQLRLGCA